MYEGGRPRGFWFWGFMGSEALLEFCGDSDVGRGGWLAGAEWGVAEGVGEGLCEELLRFEPTRFLKRAFMEFISHGHGATRAGEAGGVQSSNSASCCG